MESSFSFGTVVVTSDFACRVELLADARTRKFHFRYLCVRECVISKMGSSIVRHTNRKESRRFTSTFFPTPLSSPALCTSLTSLLHSLADETAMVLCIWKSSVCGWRFKLHSHRALIKKKTLHAIERQRWQQPLISDEIPRNSSARRSREVFGIKAKLIWHKTRELSRGERDVNTSESKEMATQEEKKKNAST